MKKTLLLLLFFAYSFSGFAQELRMLSGVLKHDYYLAEVRISKQDVGYFMKHDTLTAGYWQKARRHNRLGWGLLAAAVGHDVVRLGSDGYRGGSIVSLVGALSALGFFISESNLRKKAIWTYNRDLEDSGEMQDQPMLIPVYSGPTGLYMTGLYAINMSIKPKKEKKPRKEKRRKKKQKN